jgi:hypothetical protein
VSSTIETLRPARELAANRSHGDRLRYMAGCRCDECRGANTLYERERKAARAAGDWNGIVSAQAARRHILKLSGLGVGKRTVADCAGVPESIICLIRSGTRTQIRARTERRILAVTKAMRGDRALVPAGPTWTRINWLLEQDFTKAQIAAELGYAKPALQIDRDFVTVRNEARVLALYERYQR